MQTVLVLGAGRSSTVLIEYLLNRAVQQQWKVVVADQNVALARQRLNGSSAGESVAFNLEDVTESSKIISQSNVVVSLLPAHLHVQVARLCLEYGKHFLTASYVSPDMRALHEEAKKGSLIFLNECGLDPGIDHMSAMQLIHRIQEQGGKVTSFESFTGGLIAADADPENPWRYKFTWNPRNVVMAGQGMARYLEKGKVRFISYPQLFRRTTAISVPGYGEFEGYANRDSLAYKDVYGLENVETMLRGTLRYKGFCSAWHILVQLGMCDDTVTIPCEGLTHEDFTGLFLPYENRPVAERLANWFGLELDGPEMVRLQWSGFFSNEPIGLQQGTPAQITEHILNKRWALKPNDRDMIIMWHRLAYQVGGATHEIQSTLVCTGTDSTHTAMATTVGLPLGIAARLVLEGRIRERGVVIPVQPHWYNPILEELKQFGVQFEERQTSI